MNKIGIRSEEKHWDSRVTISPVDIPNVHATISLSFQNEAQRFLPLKNRVYSNEEILQAGRSGGAKTEIVESLAECNVLIGTKEIKDIALKFDPCLLDDLLKIGEQIDAAVTYVTVDAKTNTIQLTDFLLEDEKNELLKIVSGTATQKAIETLIGKQEAQIERHKTHIFFSHTHKGQSYNMRMLTKLIERECTLLDYELLRTTENDRSKRTVAYSMWAGIIGVLDTLWAFGEHLYLRTGFDNPFRRIRSEPYFDPVTCEYMRLAQMKSLMREIGEHISTHGFPFPLKIGITGWRGEVGRGALDILKNWGLPLTEHDPDVFIQSLIAESPGLDSHHIHLLKLDYQHLYRSKTNAQIDNSAIRNIIKNGRGYVLESNLDKFFEHFSVFLNCIVWDKSAPRLLPNGLLKRIFDRRARRTEPILPVIGDISCDPNGSVQCCRDTYPNHPVYMWVPRRIEEPILPDFDIKKADDSFKYFDLTQEGFAVMAVTNLPCEMPRDASDAFSRSFCQQRPELQNKSYLEWLAEADFKADFDSCRLPDQMKDAVILYRGKLNGRSPHLQLKNICLAMIDTEIIRPEQVLPMLK